MRNKRRSGGSEQSGRSESVCTFCAKNNSLDLLHEWYKKFVECVGTKSVTHLLRLVSLNSPTENIRPRVLLTGLDTHERVLDTHERVFTTHERVFDTHERVFTTHERVFDTRERVFGTRERVFGTRERVFGTHERVFGTRERVFGTHERVFTTHERVFGVVQRLYQSCMMY